MLTKGETHLTGATTNPLIRFESDDSLIKFEIGTNWFNLTQFYSYLTFSNPVYFQWSEFIWPLTTYTILNYELQTSTSLQSQTLTENSKLKLKIEIWYWDWRLKLEVSESQFENSEIRNLEFEIRNWKLESERANFWAGVWFGNFFGTCLRGITTFILEVWLCLASLKLSWGVVGQCNFNENQVISFWLWIRLTVFVNKSDNSPIEHTKNHQTYVLYECLTLWPTRF